MSKHEQYSIPKRADVVKTTAESLPNIFRTDQDLNIKGLFEVTNQEHKSLVGRKVGISFVSGQYSVLNADYLIAVRSVSVSPVITIPQASVSGLGKIYVIKDVSGSAAATTVTITPSGTDTINGDTGASINTNYGSVKIFSDGQNWFTY